MRDDFVVFILTHGRADNVHTYDALKRAGYTGNLVILIDNEDSQEELYKQKFGDKVYVFDKKEVASRIDSMDLSDDRRCILYARNVCYEVAKELGYTYFLELDDDYTNFRSRVVEGKSLKTVYIKDFDKLCNIILEFLESSGANTVAMSQIGDFIGGKDSKVCKDRLARKAMNSFFCKVDRPIKWIGRMNEDVNAYVWLGSQGKLFFTLADVSIDQLSTQSLKGGMSESYSDSGTYVKTFYTIMCAPSSVKVYTVGVTHKRFHHVIDWNASVPKIISGSYKKNK